jgi:hypothetical protein
MPSQTFKEFLNGYMLLNVKLCLPICTPPILRECDKNALYSFQVNKSSGRYPLMTVSKHSTLMHCVHASVFRHRILNLTVQLGNSVGIPGGQWIGVRSSVMARFLFLSVVPRPAMGPMQPPIKWVLGDISPGVRGGRVAQHSPPPSTEVKNQWSYPPYLTPPYGF